MKFRFAFSWQLVLCLAVVTSCSSGEKYFRRLYLKKGIAPTKNDVSILKSLKSGKKVLTGRLEIFVDG